MFVEGLEAAMAGELKAEICAEKGLIQKITY